MSKPASPLLTVLVYAICAVVWAVSVDLLIMFLTGHVDQKLLKLLLHYKGIIFALLSSVALYTLLKNNRSRLENSERAYMRMFRENPQPMWIYSKNDFCFLEVNDAALQLYGYTREEFLQMSILDIRPKEDVDRIRANRDNGNAGYSPSGVWRHYKKDGSLIYVKIEAFFIMYDDKPAEVISIFDVTAEHLAGEALNKQEKLLKTIINSSQNMIWAVDTHLKFITKNEVFERNAVLLTDILEPSLFWKTYYERSLRGERQVIEFESETDEDKPWKHMEISFDPIFHNEEIAGVACMAWDQTENKLHEIAIRKALERYDIVTMATNDAIWDFDLVNNKVIWNDNALHFFGFSNQEKDVEFWSSRIHPDDRQRIMDTVYEVVREGGTHWQGEYRLIDLKGDYRHVISRGYIIYDRKKQPVRMIGAMQDIEDTMVRNEEIRKLSLVASMTHNPVMITDRQARIEWVNKSFEDLTGYSLEEVKGLQPHSFLHGEDTNQETVNEIREKLASAEPCVVEILNYTSTGEPYWVVMDITPIVDASGEIERHIIIQTNITEKKKFVQQLEEKNRLLMDVAFISSHRLRMPVASMLGLFAQMDLDNLANPVNQPFLRYIEKLVNDMDDMLHEMAEKCNQIYSKNGTMKDV